jgi:hypothetical protein
MIVKRTIAIKMERMITPRSGPEIFLVVLLVDLFTRRWSREGMMTPEVNGNEVEN